MSRPSRLFIVHDCMGPGGPSQSLIPFAFVRFDDDLSRHQMPTYGRTKEDDKMDAGQMTFTFGTNGPIAGACVCVVAGWGGGGGGAIMNL